MLIGIDASRAFISQKTGTENYSFNLICALGKIDSQNKYRLYVKNNNPDSLPWPKNFSFVKISLPRLWTQAGLALAVLRNPVDILFIPAHTLPIIRRPDQKTVVTIHDLGAEFLPGYHTFPQKLYLTFSTKYAVANSTAIIAVSAATKKDLIEKFGANPAKIFVVYEGINQEKFKMLAKPGSKGTQNSKVKIEEILAKYKIEAPYILFVGTVQPRKNLERLIEAFSKITQNSPFHKLRVMVSEAEPSRLKTQNLQLVIVGKKGWLYDEILVAPAKFGVNNKVKFLDYIDESDLPAIYVGAEIFVLPSLVEGFGLPILESFAAGIPVAASNRTSIPEVAGDAALYFNPENVKEIGNSIFEVLTNLRLRQDLVEKGKKQLAKFSWEKTARETLEVFQRVYRES